MMVYYKNVGKCRYITYSKEDEAVRSIQAVHGFVLEGRSLRLELHEN